MSNLYPTFAGFLKEHENPMIAENRGLYFESLAAMGRLLDKRGGIRGSRRILVVGNEITADIQARTGVGVKYEFDFASDSEGKIVSAIMRFCIKNNVRAVFGDACIDIHRAPTVIHAVNRRSS